MTPDLRGAPATAAPLGARAGEGRIAAILAAGLVAAAATSFAGMGALVRHVAETYALHPFEIAFFRNFLVLVIFAPWFLRARRRFALPTRRARLYLLRGVLEFFSASAWYLGLTMMPLADFIAISFTSVLFSVVIAALFLGERVGLRRWIAVAIGFLGAVILLRPGAGISLGVLVALAAALTAAGSRVAAKVLSSTEGADVIIFYTVLIVAPLALGPTALVWTTPSLPGLLWLAALAFIASAGGFAMTFAYRRSDLSALAPLDFVQIPAAALFGFLIFGQEPDALTWTGAAIIVVAGLYASYSETAAPR